VTHEPTKSFEDQPITGEQTKDHVSPSLPATAEHLGTSHRHTSASNIPGYEFIKRLGKGGMGIVWLCKDIKAGRLVALKQSIRDELSSNDRIRFTTEAQAMAKLKHPNIVSVYDVDEFEDRPYFTMEYCPGGALSDYLNRTPQPATIAAQIIEQLALGIQHAHENGIIHRDLKPGNVLVSSPLLGAPSDDDSGSSMLSEVRQRLFQSVFSSNSVQLKLTDFGLAKNIDASQQMTHTQAVMGTPSYMAPEQASSARQAGASADIWSLGVMLYECITGSLPFVGAGHLELLDNIRSKDVVPPSEKVKCPKDLETICLKCLRKDPKDRYHSAQALADDLRAFQEERSISARPMSRLEKSSKWVKKNPSWAAMITVFVMTLLGGTGVSLYYAEKATKNAEIANEFAMQEQERANQLTAEKEKTEETLAHNRIFFAETTFNGTGVAEQADVLIDSIPERFRNWEWGYLKRKYQGGYATLDGHTGSVTSVCFSPDGSQIASGSGDGSLRIWCAKTGQCLLKFKATEYCLFSICFSPDGSQIASGSDDIIHILDAKTGLSLLELKGHKRPVYRLVYSPNGSRVISMSQDGTLRLWDAKSGKSLLVLNGYNALGGFTPDGTQFVAGAKDATLHLCDAKTGQSLRVLYGHTNELISVCFSPDGRRIASGSGDGTLRIWETITGRSLMELKGHTGFVSDVCFSPDGMQITSGSEDATIRIWDATTGQSLMELKGHTNRVNSVCFSPNGCCIASGSEDKTIRFWDTKTGKSQLELKGYTGEVKSICFSPDGSRIVSGSEDNTIRLWNSKTGQSRMELNGAEGQVNSVCFSPDGNRIASGSDGNTVRIWDAMTGQSLLKLNGYEGRVQSVCFSPDGDRIATVVTLLIAEVLDRKIRIWDSRTGQSLLDLEGSAGIANVCFSPDGTRIASGTDACKIRIWDSRTGQSLLELEGHTDVVTSVCFSPDGTRIASGAADKSIRIWNANTGQIQHVLKSITLQIGTRRQWDSFVSFSIDGSRIASGSTDGLIRIWDAKTGQSLLELKAHADGVNSIIFSPDGLHIASGSEDKTIRIWDSRPLPKPGEPLTSEEITFRRAMSRPDPIWHREQLESAKKANDNFAGGVQNHLFHKATAEQHLEYNRWDQATWWFVAAAALKPKPPVIDWSVPKEKVK
jgi:eukaryotic-like serine/threonine-protein kinase